MDTRAFADPRLEARRRLLTLGLGLVLVALGLTCVYASRAGGATASRCQEFAAASAARARVVTGSGSRVVVIGDSWSAGLGLAQPGRSWPSWLPGRVHVAGFSGSGFSEHASECGRVSYADRAPAALAHGADLVVVEGGLNDVDQTTADIRSGFARLMHALGGARHAGRVVVVGPAPAPSRAPAVARVDRVLRALCDRYGVRYLSAASWRLPYLSDRLHLTQAGHREFGDRVRAGLVA